MPGKNTRLLGGRPLLSHAADVARASGVVDRLVLSTEDEHIAVVGRAYGCEVPFLRPAELAADTAAMLPVIEHALQALRTADGWTPEIVLLLQPTSPLRRPGHLQAAVRMLREHPAADSVVSVVRLPLELSPDLLMRIDEGRLRPFMSGSMPGRRQDATPAYKRDGTVYAFRPATVAVHRSIYGAVCLPLEVDAGDAVTIDVEEDWQQAERRLAARSAT